MSFASDSTDFDETSYLGVEAKKRPSVRPSGSFLRGDYVCEGSAAQVYCVGTALH